MDWTDVLARVRSGEDERTEFKRWDAFPTRVGPAIAAFANSDGGILILGVSDAGELCGVPDDPEPVQERLTSFLQSGLSAPVTARLARAREGDAWIHWIEVPFRRGPEPLRHQGKVFVRRGRASVEPSSAELQDLYNTFGFVLTEEQQVPGSSMSDIDVETFRAFLAAQGIDLVSDPQPRLEQDLVNRGVLDRQNGDLRATLYGLLCFGREPQRFRPTANHWIDCVAYAGTDRAAKVLLAGTARGRADEQVTRALGWSLALGHQESVEGVRREERPLVPEKALREALVNAVAHRDYAITGSRILFEVFDDRVVVTSPGTLPNHVTVESALAGAHPRSRNELIANHLSVCRLMERRGRGFPIMRHEMRAWNGTEPILEQDPLARFVRLSMDRR